VKVEKKQSSHHHLFFKNHHNITFITSIFKTKYPSLDTREGKAYP
jgi:hypothetical protein